MKKTSVILLLLAILLNIVGISILFLCKQAQHRQEMWQSIKTEIKPEELTVFDFTATEFSKLEFTEPDKEFYYNGKMFDIIRIIKSNGKITVHCINDEAEEKLVDDFIAAVNKLKTETDNNKNPQINFLSFFSIEKHNNYLKRFFNKEVNRFPSDINFLTTYFPDTDTPPPKILI